MSQAMLRVLERVTRTRTELKGRESVTERLYLNEAKLFNGVTRVAFTIAEYWLEVIKRIMNDLDCIPTQKLRGAVSLLRDEAYK